MVTALAFSHLKRITWLAMALGLATVTGVQGQMALPPPEVMRVMREFREVPGRVAAREYESALRTLNEAIPVIRNLIQEEPSFRPALGNALYMKGLCHLELQQYGDAQNSFMAFIREFPNHPNVIKGRVLLGEALLYQERWQDIVQWVTPALQSRMLMGGEMIMARQLLGEAHFQLEMWSEAMPHLHWLFRNGPDQRTRNAAVAQLSVCMVRLQRFEDLYRVMPYIHRSEAKFDIAMNLVLLEEGDNFLRDRRQDLALLLYRMVVPYAHLREHANQQLRNLRREREQIVRRASGLEHDRRRLRNLERMIEEIEATQADLEAFPDYDLELRTRLGDVYYGLKRFEEAIQLYLSIYELAPENELAERAMYSAYMAAFSAEDPYRAIDIARQYIEAYPNGEFWDDVTMHASGLLVNLERWFETVEMVDIGLAGNPQHTSADNMLYFKGYAEFQQSLLREALTSFARIKREHPRSPIIFNAMYWHALAHLFLQNYAEARDEFRELVRAAAGGPLREDGFYRQGVAEYGLGDFDTAKQTFIAFLGEYPNSHLASEAHAMIGDILASWGQLDEALERYATAVDTGVNTVQIDYATFQQARTFELENRWQDIIDLFDDYEARFPHEDVNYTEAAYWRGNAYRQLGKEREALEIFYDAIVNYGNEIRAYGLDFILRDLIHELDQVRADSPLALDMRERLNRELEKAVQEKKETLVLRLESLQHEVTANESLKTHLRERLLNPELIPEASPFTLMVMGRLGEETENTEFTAKVYEHFLNEFEDSDLILDALVGLSENRILTERYVEAIDLLQSITDRYPTLPQAAEAYMRLGEIHRMQGDTEQAIEMFTLILSVKDWRGVLWPRALLNIGDTHAAAGNLEEAFGFFQRVYVMYIGYPQQAATAYLRSAEMLNQLGRTNEARTTLEEMLGNRTIAQQPAAQEARAMMLRLQ
ncbi:MAG: tetratricopeptide repeat protein [Verrucomicrobia bacterium]|nr:tetratricopeptide repeat protein [Verrucomicrobiota bacterium]MCH8513761.1 tetratricopeptide repeat protein [Kiritimatiellia bacterium]